MANKVGVTKRAIEKNIKNLRGMGILVHEGSDKAGYWRIVINPQTELKPMGTSFIPLCAIIAS